MIRPPDNGAVAGLSLIRGGDRRWSAGRRSAVAAGLANLSLSGARASDVGSSAPAS